MTIKRLIFTAAALMLAAGAFAQPALVTRNGITRFEINGKPFVMFGGELHNSTSSSESYMEKIGVWEQMKAGNFNTVIASSSWELIEPQEGIYDFSSVDHVILNARKHGLKVVMIWFASWKNGTSTYAPGFVKRNPKKYPLVQNRDGKNLNVLSTFGKSSMEADKKAFAALMRHIREIDPDHTVIMMQVENEMGILGSPRDYSAAAQKAWKSQVPADLVEYLTSHKGKLYPELEKVWSANGCKTKGDWEDLFGKSLEQADDWKAFPYYTEELFQAYHYAKYVGEITAAGKAEHDIPMYVNNWIKQPGMGAPGQFPSGSPQPEVLDVWRAAAPAVDLIAPDIYANVFEWTLSQFAMGGNPIFIPESKGDVARALYAFGEYDALGFAPFGFDGPQEGNYFGVSAEEFKQLGECYGILSGMGTLLPDNYGSERMRGLLVGTDNPSPSVEMGDYILTLQSSVRDQRASNYGQGAEQMAAENAALAAREQRQAKSGALIIQTSDDEFYIVGINARFSFGFRGQNQGKVLNNSVKGQIASGRVLHEVVEEGTFKDGVWIPGRRLNGDEDSVTIMGVGALRVVLYHSTVDL